MATALVVILLLNPLAGAPHNGGASAGSRNAVTGD